MMPPRFLLPQSDYRGCLYMLGRLRAGAAELQDTQLPVMLIMAINIRHHTWEAQDAVYCMYFLTPDNCAGGAASMQQNCGRESAGGCGEEFFLTNELSAWRGEKVGQPRWISIKQQSGKISSEIKVEHVWLHIYKVQIWSNLDELISDLILHLHKADA